MKIIKGVTSKGIKYIDEDGIERIIDFKKCNEGWILYRKRTEEISNESTTNFSKNERYVGQRDICANPCFIEFFTYPKFTRFEFKESVECQNPEVSFAKLQHDIVSAGWMTIDLS